jgi:recombination protein RecA
MAKKSTVDASSSELTLEEIQKAIKSIKGSSVIVGDKEITDLCTVVKSPTGIPTLDYLGGGGITKGAITILAGNPSACKTTITIQTMARIIEDQKRDGVKKVILYFDVEHAWDPEYAKRLGVDQEYVAIKHTNVIEEAFAEADALISMGFVSMLVIDSLDNMIAKKVDDNPYAATIGGTAGSLAQHLPKLHAKIIDHKVTTIIVKQARVKLDAYGSKGEVITFSGGKALRHACDSIYILKRMSSHNLDYTRIQIKAEKTRSSRMGLTLELPEGDCGIDPVRDLVMLATAHKLITVAGGGWTTWNGYKEQGEANFVQLIKSKPNLIEQLRSDVYDNIINTSVRCEGVEDGIIAEFEEDGE